MHLTTLTTTILPFIGLTTANPLLPLTNLACLKGGNPGAVFYCTDRNFKGDCTYRKPDTSCFAPAVSPQSIGPDQGGYCMMYEDRECKGSIIKWEMSGNLDNRVICPGIKKWRDEVPKVGSMVCYAGSS